MPVSIYEKADGKVLEVNLQGKLTAEDYREFVPRVEELIARHGKIRMIVRLQDFHGWDAAALWEDIKFDLKHFADIERLALIGEKQCQKGMGVICKPFTKAEVRFYEPDEAPLAYEWVEAD